jgi:hypothetical protein
MIKKAKKKVHTQLIELTKQYFDLLADSEYEEICENLFTDEAMELLSTTAWPLICYKANRLDFLVNSEYGQDIDIPIHDGLSMAFQMDLEECRTGVFRGIAESPLQQEWYKFDTRSSLCFIDGKAALLLADSPTIPLIMPFVQVDGNYLVDFEFLWLFSMEMRASLLLEISAYAQEHNNHEMAMEFLRLAAGLTEPYKRINNLMLNNSFVRQLLTPKRKQEIANEARHSHDAQRRLSSINSRQNIKVIFFAANPVDQKQLRLDEEIRDINEKIRLSEHRSSIQLVSRWAVRPTDLLQALNEVQPHVVHFSGHGSDTEDIAFIDNQGQSKFVSKAAIVELMKTMSDNIRVVVFNTCFSSGQAEAVTKHIDVAIGMNDSLGDEAARVFASQFYSTIGFGKSIQAAFDQARTAIMLEGIPEDNLPQLYANKGIRPSELVLIRDIV